MGVSGDDIRCPGRNPGTHTDKASDRRSTTVRVTRPIFIPLLAAGAVAATISAAPIAAADSSTGSQLTCYQSGPGTQCQRPGNVQFNDAPPPVQFYPYGGEAGLLGGAG